jgi:hypothetical protein
MITKKLKPIKIFTIIAAVFLINACSKVETINENGAASSSPVQQQNSGNASVRNSGKIIIQPDNRDFTYSKSVNIPLNNSNNTSNLSCSDHINTIALNYIGFKDEGACSGGGRTITITWMLGYPSGDPDNGVVGLNPVAGPGSIGKFRLPGMTSNWTTSPLSFSDEIFDEDYICHLPPYRGMGYIYKLVTASFNVTEAEYNINNDFDFDLTIATDCSTYPTIQPLNFNSDTFDQQTYKAPGGMDVTSPSTGTLKIKPLTLVCNPPHGPQLGWTPEFIVKYRIVNSNEPTIWLNASQVTFNGYPYNEITVTGLQSGATYEFKTKYKMTPIPSYSRYKYTYIPVTVQ